LGNSLLRWQRCFHPAQDPAAPLPLRRDKIFLAKVNYWLKPRPQQQSSKEFKLFSQSTFSRFM